MIKKLPSGKYQATWYNENSQRRKKSFTTKRLAEDFLAKIRLEKERGFVYGASNKVSFQVVVDDFFKLKKKKERSFRRNRQALSHIQEFFQQNKIKLVSNINKNLIRNYEVWRREDKASQSTINLEIRTLQAILNFSLSNDRILYNPLVNYKQVVVEVPFKRFLTLEEINKLFAACREEQTRDMIYFLLTTGMRSGEICYLQYGDYRDSSLIMGKKKILNEYGEPWTPKWSKERIIPLDEDYCNDPWIINLMQQGPKKDFVFLNGHGNQFCIQQFWRRFKTVVKNSGIDNPGEISPHNLRHTHISYAVARGINLSTIMNCVGIRDFQTLLRYTHYVGSLKKNLPDPTRFPWQPEKVLKKSHLVDGNGHSKPS